MKEYAVKLETKVESGHKVIIRMMTTSDKHKAIEYYQSHMHYIPDDSRIFVVEIENGQETCIAEDNTFIYLTSDYYANYE